MDDTFDPTTIDGQLFDAAHRGDAQSLGELLDAHPDRLTARRAPYEWSLLHVAAHRGHIASVDLLLRRGLDVDTRERGDNTYALHWAAAAAHRAVVERLIAAGGDVIGAGDDHQLEVIGWASCWEGCDDAAHRAIVDVLLRHGARHHIFSAIVLDLTDEVRRIVAEDPSSLNRRMSRNENHRTPLQFAVSRARPAMVALLMELGADPLTVDGSGYPAAAYATRPEVDRPIMERLHAMTVAELDSATRGVRAARLGILDLLAALSIGDRPTAERVLRENPTVVRDTTAEGGALHILAKRGDVAAVNWLLERGADPNARWPHWDSHVTPLHLASLHGHAETVRQLLAAGADPRIHDTKHDSDAIGWAKFFGREELAALMSGWRSTGGPTSDADAH
jgi:ankyrin repeat protein